MTSNVYYNHIQYDIANILQTINKQQIYVNKLITIRNNNTHQYDSYIKGQQFILNILIKQKNELCNKLQYVHEERYKEFNKSSALSGVNDVMNIASKYAHSIDTHTNKYAIEKKVKNLRSHYQDCHSNNYREYKKDRFELFLNYLITNLKILRLICLIIFIIIQFVYIYTYIYIKLSGIITPTEKKNNTRLL